MVTIILSSYSQIKPTVASSHWLLFIVCIVARLDLEVPLGASHIIYDGLRFKNFQHCRKILFKSRKGPNADILFLEGGRHFAELQRVADKKGEG